MKTSLLTVGKINELIGVDECIDAPSKLMTIILNKEERVTLFKRFLQVETDISYDWFKNYFEKGLSDHKAQKQDFTPDEVSELLTKLTEKPNNFVSHETQNTLDVGAGTGTITIKKWYEERNRSDFLTYYPHNYLYVCEEKSNTAIPFLLFNLSIRGINAVVLQIDSLTRIAKGAFLIENEKDDFLCFSDINTFPYNKNTREMFEIKSWNETNYVPRVETNIIKWYQNVRNNLQREAEVKSILTDFGKCKNSGGKNVNRWAMHRADNNF